MLASLCPCARRARTVPGGHGGRAPSSGPIGTERSSPPQTTRRSSRTWRSPWAWWRKWSAPWTARWQVMRRRSVWTRSTQRPTASRSWGWRAARCSPRRTWGGRSWCGTGACFWRARRGGWKVRPARAWHSARSRGSGQDTGVPDRFQDPHPGVQQAAVVSPQSYQKGLGWDGSQAISSTVRQQGSGAVRGVRRFLKSKESASYSDASF